jgi:heat shock protein HtpX
MWISRTREFKADEEGARISHQPMALADALVSLENAATRTRFKGQPTMSPIYIINPFRGKSIARLFSTHPSTEERVKRLREIAANMGAYS